MYNISKIFAVDFDGTCVADAAYPDYSAEDIGSVPVLRRLVRAGHRLILWTVRSNHTMDMTADVTTLGPRKEGSQLDMALEWFARHAIPLYGVNNNPSQEAWSSSPKVFCDYVIDDKSLGVPLTEIRGKRPYVNWDAVEQMLIDMRLLQPWYAVCHTGADGFIDFGAAVTSAVPMYDNLNEAFELQRKAHGGNIGIYLTDALSSSVRYQELCGDLVCVSATTIHITARVA